MRVCRALLGPRRRRRRVDRDVPLGAARPTRELRPDSNVRGWLVTIAHHRVDRSCCGPRAGGRADRPAARERRDHARPSTRADGHARAARRARRARRRSSAPRSSTATSPTCRTRRSPRAARQQRGRGPAQRRRRHRQAARPHPGADDDRAPRSTLTVARARPTLVAPIPSRCTSDSSTARPARAARRRLPHGRQPASGRCCSRPRPTGLRARRVRARGLRRGRSPSWPTRSARGSCTRRGRLDAAARQLDEYFDRDRWRTSTSRSTCGSPTGSAATCSQHLRTDPVRAHGELRRRWPAPPGRPAAVRAARHGVCAQPDPDRRARATGSCAATARIGQYRGGVDAKRWLLQTGGRRVSTANGAAVDVVDWKAVADELDEIGVRPTGPAAHRRRVRGTGRTCIDDDARFRSTVDMARHRFGEGQYRYFARRCPRARRAGCAPRAGRTCCRSPATGRTRLGRPAPWPDDLDDWLDAVPRRRADPADAAPAALRAGRLERAAPRPLRRSRVPAAGRRRARRTRRSTTPAASSSWSSSDRGRSRGRRRSPIGHGHARGVHHPRPTGPLGAGLVGRIDAPRRQHRALGASPHARPRLPRCRLNRTRDRTGSIRGATSTR